MTRAQPRPEFPASRPCPQLGHRPDDATLTQAARTARLPIVAGHVALMPDAHLGIGATVGSVIPTDSAIIPAAVGVDIGCGMAAVRTDLAAHDLPDTLEPMLGAIASAVPAGMGREQSSVAAAAERWFQAHRPRTELDDRLVNKTLRQFGTLGSGNHFVEVCLDQTDTVWIVLHSGSRGVGNQLAQRHIATARSVARRSGLRLEDPDLAHFLEGTAEFDHYMADLVGAGLRGRTATR
jgi:tRNA-splicing ligase RtcB